MEWYWWVAIGVGVVALLAVLQRAGLVDFRGTGRRGSGVGGLMSLGDEIFAPTRHEASQERARETVLPAPAPIPGDGDKGVLDGRIVINVDELDPQERG
ncbi:MAG TPA: hypothetical protein PK781_03895 [Terrimesophilobacter sp.]|nr:hypothetical protein [Terrimesophilobacter sp.]HRP99585.1 hypothetical protein [Terrimesophilobacter sp.]